MLPLRFAHRTDSRCSRERRHRVTTVGVEGSSFLIRPGRYPGLAKRTSWLDNTARALIRLTNDL